MYNKYWEICHVYPEYSLTIIKKRKSILLYAHSDHFSLKMILNNDDGFFFDNQTGSISSKKKKRLISVPITSNYITYKYILMLNHYWYKKIKFKGKGWKMRSSKKMGVIRLVFGRSHITYILINKYFLKKLGKYKFIIAAKNYKKLCIGSKTIRSVRPVNTYTKRGLRNSAELILKRKGKQSVYF